MSASFYDLLKYAATGQASPDMTYYDRMRASTLMGGAIKTLTGVPPLSFRANGKPLISWSMLGNSQQDGTPTPDAPIMPEFVGERTENLWNYTIKQGGWSASAGTIPTPYEPGSTNYTSRCRVPYMIPIPSDTMSFTCPSGIRITFVWINADGVSLGGSGWRQSGSTVIAPENAITLTFILSKVDESDCSPNDFQNIMLNTGSTPLPYEPYGWKIPVTSAGQTVPVYLGQTQTTRRVKKLVLTGEESWQTAPASQGARRFYLQLENTQPSDITIGKKSMCTHFLLTSTGNTYNQNNSYTISSDLKIFFRKESDTTLNGWEQWLSEQYAARTPVTVWYVLATPTTGIVNEPLAKIGGYADELHSEDAGVSIPTAKGANTLTVDTELPPSEMTITYRG